MTDIALRQQINAGNKRVGEYNTNVQRKKTMADFRRTHFIFGKHSTIHYSQSRFQQLSGNGKAGGRQKQTNGAVKNQATNFTIGQSVAAHEQYGTTYNMVTGQRRDWDSSQTPLGDIKAKITSVQLGKGNRFGFVSTNQRLFPNKNPNEAIQKPNKDFIATIKTHHFEFGDKRPKTLFETKRHYLSETNLAYNNKGDANQIRAQLEQAKKDDLIRNHFEIGGPSANFKETVANIQYRPMTATQRVEARATLNAEKQADLRASHWTVGISTPSLSAAGNARNQSASQTIKPAGQRPGSAFVTQSMINYKWIQPYPSRIF